MPEMNNYICSSMKRRTIIPEPVLMLLSIILVVGFQVYWLKNNYDREKRSLEIKTNIDFQETVRHLQAVKLKIEDLSDIDSMPRTRVRIMVGQDIASPENMKMRPEDTPPQEVITMVNAIRDKTKNDSAFKTLTTVISTGKEKIINHPDSFMKSDDSLMRGKNKFFRFLYGVDSLQDSIKVSEINKSFTERLKQDKAMVPFSITKTDSAARSDNDPDFSSVTVGFAHPKTYHLELGNTFPYLIKRIAIPIVFSIFLVGLTIVSFLLLYRNLLRQRSLAAIKNEFISNITHELKTPIATVGVAIEALRNFDAVQDPAKTKEYLDISASELQRLGLLVDKVLNLSMFENKTVGLKREMVDMRQLVNEVMQIMKLQFEKQHAEVHVTTSGDSFMIEADRLHMASVLYNLLDNALKYSLGNPVIAIHLCSPMQNILELKVGDNGQGIDKEYKVKIFEKFFRVPGGDKHNIKGYGLGLSYVKEIIASHMGYIEVESDPGKGSTFIIRIPMKEAPVVDFGDGRRVIKKAIRVGK
jgi:two-component system phosphate regulon sensor histidine kinase PhoR